MGNRVRTERSSISRYMGELDRYPLLEAGEFDRLIGKAQAGDREAFDRIVQGNLRFVVRTAAEYAHPGLPLDDLVAEGNLGLIKAIERFDPDRGHQFSTYAVWWIRNAIQRAIRNHVHSVRLPTNRYEDFDKLRKSANRLSQRLGRQVSSEEAGADLEMTSNRTKAALLVQDRAVSLDKPVDESETRTLYDALPGALVSPEERLMQNQNAERVQKAMRNLSVRDAEIISLTFGLEDEPLNLSQVGQRFGISKERVRQLRNRALEELRCMLAGEEGYGN